jgi:hypothetical protein
MTQDAPIRHRIEQAARVTMVGAAEVELEQMYDIPDLPPYRPYRGTLRGRADFDAGRCFLAGAGERLILDRADEYRFHDGRWIVTRGAPGTQATMNPAWLLGVLARPDALISATETDEGEIVAELDVAVAGRTAAAGIWPEWRMVTRLRIADGRITRMVLDTLDATSPQPRTSETFQLSPRQSVEPVEVPAGESVVDGEEYIAERMNQDAHDEL